MKRLYVRGASVALLAGLVTAALTANARGDDQGDLLSLVKTGHRAGCEAIRTLSATIVMEQVFPASGWSQRCAYWRSGETVRIQRGDMRHGGDDYLLKDAEIRQVGHGPGTPNSKPFFSATRKPPGEFFCECDLWCEMLFSLPGPAGGQYPLDQFLRFAKDGPDIRRKSLDGHPCLRLSMAFDTTTGLHTQVTLWFDTQRNYLIRKLEAAYGKGEDRAEAENLEFVEPEPGVFLPTKCRRRNFRGGKLRQERVTTLGGLSVNAPISRSVFQLPAVPRGTILKDWIQGTTYPIDDNWRPIGPAKPWKPVVAPAQSKGTGGEYRSQSTSEPRPLTSWILPFSLVVSVVAAGVLVYRRYRLGRG